jgi:hypothetical protein
MILSHQVAGVSQKALCFVYSHCLILENLLEGFERGRMHQLHLSYVTLLQM